MTGSHDRTLKIWDLQHKACESGVVSSPATPPKERRWGESGCIGQILGLC